MKRILGPLALVLLGACEPVETVQTDAPATVSSDRTELGTITTQLAVDVHRDGRMEIADAIEIPAKVRLSPMITSEYVYEVRSAGRVIAAQPLRELHHARGIAEPGKVEEYEGISESTRVLIYVPGKSAKDEDYDVAIHRLRTIPASSPLTTGNFAAMAQANGASVFARLDGKTAAARIRQIKAAR